LKQDGLSMDRAVKPRRLTPGRLVGLCFLLLVTLGFIYLYPSLARWAAADRSADPSRLRMGQVSRGDLLRDVSVQGRIIAADHPTLVSPSQGVVSLLVKAGDVVRRGDVMARVDSPELRNRLEQERSTLQSMQSDLERLKITSQQDQLKREQEIALLELKLKASEKARDRALQLYREGLGSAIDYEKAEQDLEIVKLELAHSRQNIRLARDNADFEIRTREMQLERQRLVLGDLERKVQELAVPSPVNGLVSRVDIKDKDTVQAAQILFSVVDLSRFEVEVLIPENYANEIAMGTAALTLYEGREYPGGVKSLSPEVQESQFKGVVAFSQGSPSGLKENQRVDTRLLLDSRKNVLKVPRGPFLESLGGRQVYVVEGSMASLRPIRVGAVSVTEVEITSGLSEGDRIIISDMTQFEGVQSILLRQ
jgi:HlyD family secretion protein